MSATNLVISFNIPRRQYSQSERFLHSDAINGRRLLKSYTSKVNALRITKAILTLGLVWPFLPSLPSVVAARGCMHHHIIRRLRRRRRPWALLLLIFFKNCGPKRRRFRAFDLRRRRCRHCDLRRPLVKQTASCGTKARAAPAPRLTGQLRSANGLLKGRTRAHQATVGPREATKVGPQSEDFLKYGRTWNWRFRLLSFETVFNS